MKFHINILEQNGNINNKNNRSSQNDYRPKPNVKEKVEEFINDTYVLKKWTVKYHQ
jgi:hypothetical protein